MKKKNIVILGSTGSVGKNAVRVARHLKDKINVIGIAALKNTAELAEQAARLNCSYAVVADDKKYEELKNRLPASCAAMAGISGITEIVKKPEVDLVLCSIVGTDGLLPVLEAIKAGKDIAIASKEVLVAAGEIVMSEVKRTGVKFIPVDSEHSAVFQCLEGRGLEDASRIILTASGGPFRDKSLAYMEKADYKSALAHPTWDMGPKITIDSATLVNKGLEVIEAKWLFNMDADTIDVVVHPQSIIHSMVEFIDGSVLAQMSEPDMCFPIQYAFTYPEKSRGAKRPLNFSALEPLSFEKPDHKRFPALRLAYDALKAGGTMPAVYNFANEVAVEKFRKGEISFIGIAVFIEKVMSAYKNLEQPSLDAILEVKRWTNEISASGLLALTV
jgi:1-deoxy-D-xylulose-5-phosphate reductoisomerase